jgi:hypothetical protein
MLATDENRSGRTCSLKSLLLVMTLCAFLAAGVAGILSLQKQHTRTGEVENPADWPRALQAILEANPEAADGICVYEIDAFIDHCSIWKIDGEPDWLKKLIENEKLERTTLSHPRAAPLLEAFPNEWNSPDWQAAEWYATRAYGSAHLEGIDLFLIAIDRDGEVTVVLHEWVF